jgi:hypothetical protein
MGRMFEGMRDRTLGNRKAESQNPHPWNAKLGHPLVTPWLKV